MTEPRTIDQYELRSELGFGGMAVVWRAHDHRLGREVALKVLHDHVAARQENRDRFEREARAVARLEHPNIIRIYAVSQPEARTQYIATELIEGPTLRDFVAAGGFPLPEIAAFCCILIARALSHAHEHGVIHRDVKPENIMLTRDGSPRLMDFGLARVLDAQKLTQTGSILGSPAHMSPELIEGGTVDEGADIFAFGTVMYFCCVGTLPFDGRNPAVILNSILTGEYPAPQTVNPKISPALAAVIARCLQTARADRFDTMADVVKALVAAVADFGFDEPDIELQRFFRDPAVYGPVLTRRVVDALLKQARTAIAERRVAAAMRICDRALAVDPSSVEAGTLIEALAASLARRRRLRQIAAVIASFLALAAISAAIFGRDDPAKPDPAAGIATAPGVDPPPTPRTRPVENSDRTDTSPQVEERPQPEEVLAAVNDAAAILDSAVGDAVATLPIIMPALVLVGDPARGGMLTRNPVATEARGPDSGSTSSPSQEAALLETRILVLPGAAFVRIDGQPLGQAGDLARRTLMLSRGRHVLEASIEGLRDAQISEEFFVVESGAALRFRVPWPPAMLEVSSDVPGEVFVDDRMVGRTGERLDVVNDGTDSTFEARLVVVPRGGGEPTVREIELRSGQVASIDLRRR